MKPVERKNEMKCKEFYQFFLKYEEQPDNVLADMVAAKFVGVNYTQALDLISATRYARADANKNLVEGIKK